MNTHLKILIILASVGLTALPVAAKPWRGIEPLRSTKADVVRLFNQCNDNLRGCSFELENEHVFIHFSSPLRTRHPRYACVGDLPLGTVLRIEITPKSSLRFSRKGFGQSSFRSFDPSPHRTGTYRAYLDKKIGLLINTRGGKVVEVIYFAASSDSNLCQSYSLNPEEFISVEARGMPPTVSINCPTTTQDNLTLTAHTFDDDPELQFFWTVSAGKVIKGQSTDTITVDVTGLTGQMIKVQAEVIHKSGLAAAATCEVRIHSPQPSLNPRNTNPSKIRF